MNPEADLIRENLRTQVTKAKLLAEELRESNLENEAAAVGRATELLEYCAETDLITSREAVSILIVASTELLDSIKELFYNT